ncbi:MAG TPA: phosphodiesterase [Alphaproteobacteria bacterium]|nr:phosphodiesterase [Alphaproteobacteria bacterium]
MLIAQISDFHVTAGGRLAYRRVDTSAALERAVAHLNALSPQPDLILATGDLVDLGTPDEYAHLRDLLAPLKAPVFIIPGNHDAREPLREAFAGDGYLPKGGDFLHYTLDLSPVRIVAMDTVAPGHGHGELCDTRIAWLDKQLSDEPERPTIIIMHHPPFDTGIAHMDKIGLLRGAKELGDVIARHPQVERILCGHLHRAIQTRWHGTIASTAPSTAHQVALDLRADGPSAFVMEPPGFQLHRWQPGLGLVSHTGFFGRYDGPYPFFEASGDLVV